MFYKFYQNYDHLMVGSSPCPQRSKLERFATDKHSSLLRMLITDVIIDIETKNQSPNFQTKKNRYYFLMTS